MNWGQLKAAVVAYAHRADLDPMFSVFLALAEQRIYIGEASGPKVRVAAMRQFTTMANGTRPTGFLEAIKVAEHDKPDRPLEYRPLERMPRESRAYSWDGAEMVLSREQAFPIDLTYYARLETPSADADTNWLMTNAPGVYLSSLLVEFGRWSRDDEFGMREAANYSSAVSSLNSQERAAAVSGSVLRMKTRGP